jgi:hypothetical protein
MPFVEQITSESKRSSPAAGATRRLDRMRQNTYLNSLIIALQEILMAYDIRLFKLVTGELVIGKFDAAQDCINDVAALQTVPTQQGGVQMLMLPYGYPFETEFCGVIPGSFFLYRYKNTPEELQNKYLEATTNLTLSSGFGKIQGGGMGGGLGGGLLGGLK